LNRQERLGDNDLLSGGRWRDEPAHTAIAESARARARVHRQTMCARLPRIPDKILAAIGGLPENR
jgi:hypothetical protein